jgi:hypothetical protein
MHEKIFSINEDEYYAHMEAIIQRDFYPNIPKLQNKLEWIEAIRSGDMKRIRRTQSNITARCYLDKNNQENTYLISDNDNGHCGKRFYWITEEKIKTSDLNYMLLDEFCALHNSHDNETFKSMINREKNELLSNKTHMLNRLIGKDQKERVKYSSLKWSNLSWHWSAQNPLFYPNSNSFFISDRTKLKTDASIAKKRFTCQINYRSCHLNQEISDIEHIKAIKTNYETNLGRVTNTIKKYEFIGKTNKIIESPESKSTVKLNEMKKTPIRLDSHDFIHLTSTQPGTIFNKRFSMKEPSRKEEAARRLINKT